MIMLNCTYNVKKPFAHNDVWSEHEQCKAHRQKWLSAIFLKPEFPQHFCVMYLKSPISRASSTPNQKCEFWWKQVYENLHSHQSCKTSRIAEMYAVQISHVRIVLWPIYLHCFINGAYYLVFFHYNGTEKHHDMNQN